ncbi:putative holin-like toxin [Paenibacillus gansuensis]|uniref:Holin-like toxin n=1 Tax=Paenibacillus gansuensis TaxID=306542 RepID=A0ABW5PLA0_9BACL
MQCEPLSLPGQGGEAMKIKDAIQLMIGSCMLLLALLQYLK